ncbi:MAG: helix-turn-helix transcriptional regulator [Clostridia bacterium]|nr:helix-turn-helix transcriptional regulator [Clostridia bacterium]
MLYTRIRSEREKLGYTREKFAELLDVSVSYLAELERGKTGISVKLLMKVCTVLGLSADYILFGEERDEDRVLLDKFRRVDPKYLPLLNDTIANLLILSEHEE